VPSLSGVRLPTILAGYRQRDALTQINIEELTYIEMVDAIAEGRVDFGIGPCTDPPPDNIAFAKAVEDPLCVLLPIREAAGHVGTAPLSLLASLPLIFMRNTVPLQRNLGEVARAHGIRLNSRTKVGHVQTAIGMVRAGAGAAIVPLLALPDTMDPELVALPIDDPALIRWVGVLTLHGRRLQPSAAKLARYISSALVSTCSLDHRSRPEASPQ
jgi:DNA-binding transcriptional LysR family regulator